MFYQSIEQLSRLFDIDIFKKTNKSPIKDILVLMFTFKIVKS